MHLLPLRPPLSPRAARWTCALLLGLAGPALAQPAAPNPEVAAPNPEVAAQTPEVAPKAPPKAEPLPFWIGSYGRIGLSSDTAGAPVAPVRVAAFAPRLLEDNYLELDVGYRAYKGRHADVKVLTTLAFFDDFFHFTGRTSALPALRRAYVEAHRLWRTGAFAWLGSRWVRGDDIYLFDLWPLDELNLVGAGGGWRGKNQEFSLSLGLNRLEDGRHHQRVAVPANDFGATEIDLLDRQRQVIAALYEHRFGGQDGALGLKAKLYAELHHLPSGERALSGSYQETEYLPDDLGFVVGAQLGLWNLPSSRDYLNLWLRYAGGLAVYDELGGPTALNRDRRAVDAKELRAALAGNYEGGLASVQYGGYLRWFDDGDVNEKDFDDRVETAWAVRPQLKFGLFTPGAEASFQASRPQGLNPRTLSQATATATQVALIPALSFGDEPGSYTRPQLRFIYAITWLNQAALDLYALEDPRSQQATQHSFTLRAEWWFGRDGGY